MSAQGWPTDAELDALLAQAAQTKSHALRFDPEAPGGFQVLTAEEDRELIDAIGLPEQRYDDDREHLIRVRDDARDQGDAETAEAADAHLEVLAAERRTAERHTPEPAADWWDRARFDDSLELAGTQPAFPTPELEGDDAEREA